MRRRSCTTGVRQQRSLSQRGFELANGLPFVASDMAIHALLGRAHRGRSPTLASRLGTNPPGLGRLRAENCWRSTRIASKATASGRCAASREDQRPSRTRWPRRFSSLIADTHQPVCFTTATSSRTATTARDRTAWNWRRRSLTPQPGADPGARRHWSIITAELFDHVQLHTPFDLLVPMKNERARLRKQLRAIPPEQLHSPLGWIRHDETAVPDAAEQPTGRSSSSSSELVNAPRNTASGPSSPRRIGMKWRR